MRCSFSNDLTLPPPCIGRRRAGATLSPRLCSSPRSLSFYDLSPPSTYTGRLARSCAGSIWKVGVCGCVRGVNVRGPSAAPSVSLSCPQTPDLRISCSLSSYLSRSYPTTQNPTTTFTKNRTLAKRIGLAMWALRRPSQEVSP